MKLQKGVTTSSIEIGEMPEVVCQLPNNVEGRSPSRVFTIGSILNRDCVEPVTPIATAVHPVFVCTDGLWDYQCMFAGKAIRYVPDIDSNHYGGDKQYVDTIIRRVKECDIPHHVIVLTSNMDSFLVGPSVVMYVGTHYDCEAVLANDWGWRVSTLDDMQRVDDNLALDVLEHRGEKLLLLNNSTLTMIYQTFVRVILKLKLHLWTASIGRNEVETKLM